MALILGEEQFAEVLAKERKNFVRSEWFWKLVGMEFWRKHPVVGTYRVHKALAPVFFKPNRLYLGQLEEGIAYVGHVWDIDTRPWYADRENNRALVGLFGSWLASHPGGFVDIGTHYGILATLVQRTAGRPVPILGIEPVPRTALVAQCNFALNGVQDVKLANTALGPESGDSITLSYSLFHSGNATTGTPLKPRRVERARVSVTTLDDLAKAVQFGQVGAIKLDVEGYEYEVLQGAKTVLAESLPLVVFEYNVMSSRRGMEVDRLLGVFRELGYSFARLTANRKQPLLEPLEGSKAADVVCLPPGASDWRP